MPSDPARQNKLVMSLLLLLEIKDEEMHDGHKQNDQNVFYVTSINLPSCALVGLCVMRNLRQS